jgi:hypothetical protein
MTPFIHVSFIPDIFPTHFNKFVMDFGMWNVFHIQKSNPEGLVIDIVLKAL